MTTKKSTGDNMQPCLTPLPTTKGAERVSLCSTRHLTPLYVDLMTDTNFLGIPLLLSANQRHSLSPLSKEFLKSTRTNANRNGIQHFARWLSAVCQCGQRKMIQLCLPAHDLWWNKDAILFDPVWPCRWFWRLGPRHIFLANYRKSLDYPFLEF